MKPRTFLAAFLVLVACAAQAQVVYRCGNSYGSEPCPGGKALVVDDPRTPEEAERARAAARIDAERAERLEKARLAQEAKAPRAIVMATAEPPRRAASRPVPAKVAKAGKRGRKGEARERDQPFTATVPAAPKASKQAARASR